MKAKTEEIDYEYEREYQYECTACGHQFNDYEENENHEPVCPACGSTHVSDIDFQ